jgi:RNA polymerase sigma factor (sigma-70 family)
MTTVAAMPPRSAALVDASEADLLRAYVAGDHAAFAELVRRHVDAVHAAARRQVTDDALADDVVQAVFLVLAEKAAHVPADRPLIGWLLMTARYCASNARRAEQRRVHHERRAAAMSAKLSPGAEPGRSDELQHVAPVLDEGLMKLRAVDRDALLLRFFQGKSHAQVGQSLGISEEAAAKRCARAVDRLRSFFRRRGVAVSGAALAAVLTAEGAHAAPAALTAAVVSTTSAAGVGAGVGVGGGAAAATSSAAIAKGAMILMASQKAKLATLAVAGLLFSAGGGVVVYQALANRATARTVALAPPGFPPPVALPAIAPATGAAAAAGDPAGLPAATASFSEGLVVELIAICDPDVPGGWWRADGSPAPAPQVPNLGRVSATGREGREKRQFILRATGKDSSDRSVRLQFADRNLGGGGATSSSGSGQVTWINHATTVVAGVPATDLNLVAAVGPWTDEAQLDAATGQLKALTTSGRRVRFGQVEVTAGLTKVYVQSPDDVAPGRDYRVVAVLKTGKWTYPHFGEGFADGRSSYGFRVPRDQIAHFTFATRRQETVTVRNVAMTPAAQPTAVAADPPMMGP